MKISFTRLVLFAPVMLVSCYTSRPDSLGVSSPDYNQRVNVTNPHYTKTISPIGYGVMAATVAGGAYLGMKSKIVQTQKGVSRNDSKPINALIGGVVTLGVNLMINKASGYKQQKPVVDFTKWVKDGSKYYKGLDSAGSNYFRAIHQDAEDKFIVKTLQDVRDFRFSFPNSRRTNTVLNNASQVLNRASLAEVVKVYRNAPVTDVVKLAILKSSGTVEEVLNASEVYGDMGVNIEKLSALKAADYKDVIAFSKRYPTSDYKQEVFLNALRRTATTDFGLLKNYYENYSAIPASTINNLSETQKHNYVLFRFDNELGTDTSMSAHLALAQQLDSIRYDFMAADFFFVYWNQLCKTAASGSEIINLIFTYSRELSRARPHLKIDQEDVAGFVRARLEEVIRTSVTIRNSEVKKITSDEDWKHWQVNFLSDKIFQYQPAPDNVAAVYSAEIVNTSRFDIPVRLWINAHFFGSVKVGGALGGLANVLQNLTGDHSMDAVTQNITDFGNSEENYYDVVKANSTTPVQMPVRTRMPFSTAGISLMGLYSGKYEIEPKGLVSRLEIADKNINKSLLDKQNEWATNIINGKYNTKLQGIFSGKEYDIKEEDIKIDIFFKKMETATAEGMYTVTKSSNASVVVLKRPNEETGSIMLSTKSEKYIDKNFYSAIYSKNNNRLKKEFTNLLEDGSFGYFKANDFPLIVSVNYLLYDDTYLSATIELNEPGAYEVNIKKQ